MECIRHEQKEKSYSESEAVEFTKKEAITNADYVIYDITIFVDGTSESGYFETFEKTYQIKVIP